MAVEVIGGLKRKEGGHAQDHRPEGFIAQVEVIMRVPAALLAQNAIVWILGGKLGSRAGRRAAWRLAPSVAPRSASARKAAARRPSESNALARRRAPPHYGWRKRLVARAH